MANTDLVQCNACSGIYRPLQADGTEYYHVCPPRRVVGAKPAPTLDAPDAVAPVFAPIAQPRNENVVGIDDNDAPVLAAPGAGSTPVFDPAVIAAYYQQEETP